MKITKMRRENGSSLEFQKNSQIVETLYFRLKMNGFITQVAQLTSTSIKVGMHMCCFRIDPKVLGHNADTSHYARQTKKGYRRTCIPTWDERVDFNNIVNDVLDEFGVKADVRSGDVIVRSFDNGRRYSWSHYETQFGERCFYEIAKESEMINPIVDRGLKQMKLQLIKGGAVVDIKNRELTCNKPAISKTEPIKGFIIPF